MALSPATIDAMLAAGLSAEQLAAVVKAELLADAAAAQAKEQARLEAQKEGNRVRQARWRNRNNGHNAVSDRDERDPLKVPPHPPITTPEDITPSDPKGSSVPKGTSTPRKARNRALPTDWQPGSRSQASCAELGRSAAWMHRTATDMRTWAESKGEVRADWDATHVGWMRREAQREGERPGPRAGPSEKSSPATRLMDRYEARRESDQHTDRPSNRSAFIDHEADGGSDRQVHEPSGGQAGRFSSEAPLRIVGSRW